MTQPVRLGVVGFGPWGKNYVRAARDSGEAQVVEVVVRSGSRALLDPEAYGQGFSIGASLEDAISCVDAVVYAGHPSGAVEVATSVLAARKPLLVEKPAGLSLADALQIQAVEQEHDGLVLVGHQHLFAEGYEAFRDMVSDCADVRAIWGGPGPYRDYSPLWDYGPHAVSALLGLKGLLTEEVEVLRLSPTRCRVLDGRGDRGSASVVFGERAGGSKVALLEAHVDGCRIRYDAYASEVEPPLTRQVRAFARAVRAGGTDDWRFGARWAVNVAYVLEAASVPVR